MAKRVQHLVVDSGAFIRNSPVHEYAENIYSVDGAVKEIKDKATLERLQFLPYELKLKVPEPENYKYVLEFSKKTGDYTSLSATDLQIIALTYQLQKDNVGTEQLNKEPSCQVYGSQQPTNLHKIEGFYCPHGNEDGGDKDSEGNSPPSAEDIETSFEPMENDHDSDYNTNETEIDLVLETQESTDKELQKDVNCNYVNNEEESWITSDNLAEVQRKMGHVSLDVNTNCVVACVTTDFAIQNVLIQMGLNVVSVDGVLIRNTRVFILRCFACFKTTNDTTKRFCPNCGNKTLKRVSVSVNEDGSKNVHINFRRPINVRGTKYSLPTPRGGKHSSNPVLCEDQPLPQNRPPKSTLQKIDIFSPDYIAAQSPFTTRDIYSRAAGLGVYGLHEKQGRKNPNEWSKRTGNKKKNKKL